MSIDPSLVGEAMKQSVPWVNTAGLDYTEVTTDRVVVTLPDAENIRNHVGGPHAAMIFGLGESATGAVAMVHFGDQLGRAVPLPVRAEIAFRRVALGPLRAEAVLGRPAADVIAELDAGERPEFPVTVTVTDAEGKVTSELSVVWTLRPNR